jgi:hypothetical protein
MNPAPRPRLQCVANVYAQNAMSDEIMQSRNDVRQLAMLKSNTWCYYEGWAGGRLCPRCLYVAPGQLGGRQCFARSCLLASHARMTCAQNEAPLSGAGIK